MMKPLYSIRMRAAQGGPHESGGHHISGAERIVTMDQVGTMVQSLADRALHHSKGVADFINITVDLVPTDSIRHIPPVLDVEEHETSDVSDARLLAKKLLSKTEITSTSVDKGGIFIMWLINIYARRYVD
nr:6-carboxyhexanoate--CoA ligase [Veillonella denticariosi]